MKKLILILSALLWASNLQAQVTLDGTPQSSSDGSNVTSHSLTGIVIGNNPNRVLVVPITINSSVSDSEVSGCKFDPAGGNITMTKLKVIRPASGNLGAYLWFLKAPTVMTATVTCTSVNSGRAVMGSVSLYNVASSTSTADVDPTTTFRTNTGTLAGITGTGSGNLNLTTVINDYCIAAIHVGNNVSNPVNVVPGGSQTEKWDVADAGGSLWRSEGSIFVATGTSTDLSATWTNNQFFAMVATAVIPASGAGPLFKQYYDMLRSSLLAPRLRFQG